MALLIEQWDGGKRGTVSILNRDRYLLNTANKIMRKAASYVVFIFHRTN
jgi:hypothetical protein